MNSTQTFPTRGNLLAARRTRALAHTGYTLMDRKRNILVREMMQLVDRAAALRQEIDTTWSRAYAALQRSNIILGVQAGLAAAVPVETGVSVTLRSVMGVELPTVQLANREIGTPPYPMGSTGPSFDEAFLAFHRVKEMTIQLAEVENCVYRLAVAIKKTQSRANALQNMVLPDLDQTIRHITDALEEKEREEFARLKVIKRSGHK